jgi:catechol 2,3-dioxygenase-like lactoylglutathione lyase family enzyme
METGVLLAAPCRADRSTRSPPDGGEDQTKEANMSSADEGNQNAAGSPLVQPGQMRLEVVILPVSDVDRARDFYVGLDWRLDADVAPSEDFRIVQLTPPGSECSIQFGVGITSAAPGSVQGLYLAVSDIEAVREQLIARGVEVSESFHESAPGGRFNEAGRAPGPSPNLYGTFATFSDPDGNGWLLQEITARLPGR